MTMHDLEFDLSTLRPEPGDLLVVKVRQCLNPDQRAQIEALWLPRLAKLGCEVLLLDGGVDIQLIKKASPDDGRAAGEPVSQVQ